MSVPGIGKALVGLIRSSTPCSLFGLVEQCSWIKNSALWIIIRSSALDGLPYCFIVKWLLNIPHGIRFPLTHYFWDFHID